MDDISILSFDDISWATQPTVGLSVDASSVSTSIRNTKLYRFIITFFPATLDPKFLTPEFYFTDTSLFDIWIGQFEICPDTTRLHAHIYIECNRDKRPRFNYINKIFREYHSSVHIKQARSASESQRQCAINYVTKVLTRVINTEPFFWSKNKLFEVKTPPKKEPDDEEKRLYIETKPKLWSWDQIVHENIISKQLLFTCSWGEKYHKGRTVTHTRRNITSVILFYGAGGTGKTTLAKNWDAKEGETPEERYYRRNTDDGHFWGGGRTAYKSQRIIHFEEFTGQEMFSKLKEICDVGSVGPSVNIKNGGTDLNHDTVIITSNVHPAGWYHKLWSEDNKQFHPFWRRVTMVLFFPTHRPDGSDNIPGQGSVSGLNPDFYHYIDQTNEWLEMKGDYNKCVSHAMQVWPLKQDTFVLSDKPTMEQRMYKYAQTNKWD